MTWTAEREQRAIELFGLGFSAGKTAADIGGISRNAVIGKWSRLGLRRGTNRPVHRVSKHRPERERRWSQNSVLYLPKPTPLPEAPPPAPDWRGILLEDLTNSTCRYAGDSPPYLFCGDPTADLEMGRPYCPYHHAICIVEQTNGIR